MMNKYANLSLAVGKVFEAEADTFLSQLEPDTGIELSAKTERKLRKLVKRRDKSYYPLICTAGRRIACIAAIIVVFAVSAMSIKPVRAGVFGFFVEHHSNYTHFTTTYDVLSVDDTKMVEYSIEVPEGFEEHILTDKPLVLYHKKYTCGDKFIMFSQSKSEHYSANFDNERSTMENYTDENGQTYTIIDFGYSCFVIWRYSDFVFQIHSNYTKDEILELSRTVHVSEGEE